MGQLNLISYCIKDEITAASAAVGKLLSIKENLENQWYVTWADVSDDLEDLIYRELKEKVDKVDKQTYEPLCSTAEGQRIMAGRVCPSLMPEETNLMETIYKHTCRDIIHHYYNQQRSLSEVWRCFSPLQMTAEELQEESQYVPSATMPGRWLGQQLQSLELKEDWNCDKKWEMISEVWVEILAYAASHSTWNEHSQHLGKGGELLTHVRLLMAHLGLSSQYLYANAPFFLVNDQDILTALGLPFSLARAPRVLILNWRPPEIGLVKGRACGEHNGPIVLGVQANPVEFGELVASLGAIIVYLRFWRTDMLTFTATPSLVAGTIKTIDILNFFAVPSNSPNRPGLPNPFDVVCYFTLERKRYTDSFDRNNLTDIFGAIFYSHPLLGNHKRWSRSMGQLNLISYCVKDETITAKSAAVGKLLATIKTLVNLENQWYVTWVDVSDELEELICRELKEKVANYTKPEPFCSTAEGLSIMTGKGDYVLEKRYGLDPKTWLIASERYDHSLLAWHIATDLCYYDDLVEKLRSDYMLYLLIVCPSMMPEENFMDSRYTITCQDIIDHYGAWPLISPLDKVTQVPKSKSIEARRHLLRTESQKFRQNPQSASRPGRQLGKRLQEQESEVDWSNGRKWDMISEVWVEMLAYAASHGTWNEHGQHLRNGGELLTHVRLLMAHLGLSSQYDKHGIYRDVLNMEFGKFVLNE
ncbi:DUF4220 domain-containing protein [Citrus sinensis]|uniref:DUF4220 domain-containing protein n=1 Tax=Citrus sinensis TaxID=2711 RepID=A0ACB8MUQ9_CITSI|nr:DUF4220 domain-containing protein [Citrus sinensis]